MPNKTFKAPKFFSLRASVVAVASCLALSGIPLAVHAAGLGKIAVFSALGQPLRAEIEVSATREELSGMKAQLASPEAFKQAGLDYATTLLGVRFSLDKRANGQSVIRLSSDKPINDPFIDMLLELNWPAGRLVREYTFLLDPPEMAVKAVSPVATVTAKPLAASNPSEPVRARSAIDDEVRNKAVARIRSQSSASAPAPAQNVVEKSVESTDAVQVKRGDTLNKIAGAVKPQGVSLDQMLVGLMRANQDAFDGGNMNRLKAGKILAVPEKTSIEAITTGEAKKIVAAQSSDWNAYRSKLAAVAAQTPVKEDLAKQEASGKITAKVEEKSTASAEAKDQLKVSKTDMTSAKPAANLKRTEEDLIAKEKALKEANERLQTLEKSVTDLQKLVELKNLSLAELQNQAVAKATPIEEKKPVEEAKTPVPVLAPASAVVENAPDTKPVEPPVKPEETKPEVKPEEVKPQPQPQPQPQPVEVPKPKPKPVIVPPPEETGFIEELLDNPLALAGGGGILALIAAYVYSRRRRSDKEEAPLDLSSTLSSQSSSLTANSVFRNTGGQSVDTSHTPVQTDFSQAGPGSIDTDEVDPVAEADVYMAYGRDAQAEEILVEARLKDPKRYAIHLKLLEIYSNRKDTKQFETLATDLYSETGGVGADWEKAAAMGLKLDPQNPLFSGAAQAPAPFDADATVIVSPQSMRNTVTLPGELSQLAEEAGNIPSEPLLPDAPVVESIPDEAADLTSLDFDLGLGDAKPPVVKSAMDETLKLPEPVVEAGALDFDIGSFKDNSAADATVLVGMDFNLPEASVEPERAASTSKEVADLDFDIGFEASPEVQTEVPPMGQHKANELPGTLVIDDDGVEFDVSLTESTFLGRSMPEPSSFDMDSIDLDLNTPELAMPPSAPPAPKAVQPPETLIETDQVSTNVNPDFFATQSETLVNPQFGFGHEHEQEDDFSAAQAATVVNPEFGQDEDLAPEFEISANEEVTTKLDLAKAYEEMGDLEGARELLQEVLKEGDTSQREKAQAVLTKIGE